MKRVEKGREESDREKGRGGPAWLCVSIAHLALELPLGGAGAVAGCVALLLGVVQTLFDEEKGN